MRKFNVQSETQALGAGAAPPIESTLGRSVLFMIDRGSPLLSSLSLGIIKVGTAGGANLFRY